MNMQQLELTAVPIARRTDPDTSHAAAQSISDASELRQRIYLWLQVMPCVDRDLETAFRFYSPSSVRSRRSELVRMGKVRDSGRRRKLSSGRLAIEWETI